MDVKEYLEVTNAASAEGAGGRSTADSKESDLDEDNLSLNDPDDMQKNLARFDEIDSALLHGDFAERLGVDYLSIAAGGDASPTEDAKQLTGKIIDPNNRFIVDLPCRRETPCPPGVDVEEIILPPFRHVTFVVDTSSPHSYLSVEAMQAISSTKQHTGVDGDNFSTCTIPDFIDVELRSGTKVEFHLSPGSNSEVNILGGSILKLADLSTNVKDKEFILKFLE